MSKIIIFDFEVFKYDTLLGAKIVDDNSETIWQSWSLDEIRNFFNEHAKDLWVGHNNLSYDNNVMKAILERKNVYAASKRAISSSFKSYKSLPILNYDIMQNFFSLKMSEFACGKNISETQVNFDIDRPLTEEEKRKTEAYNRDDLEQTSWNFIDDYSNFDLRLSLVDEFKLPLAAINYTEARIASTVLMAKQVENIADMYVKPKLYDTLQLNNKDVIDFYLSEGFRNKKTLTTTICGVEHRLGSGGIHAAQKKVHKDKLMYFDVSGYYNLVMLNYDLLPRTLPPEGKAKYEYMYHEQLRLKKIDPKKRWLYKTILLAVFGAMMNEYTDFYDPQRGSLVTITGQLFLVDLLEKLEGKGQVIQSNTDGIMFEPNDWSKEEEIWDIVRSWENRTGFVIKKEHVYNLWQRDVNNYVCLNENNVVTVKGECVGSYDKDINHSTLFRLWELKQPKIIAQAVVDYLLYRVLPEETILKFCDDLRYFHFACKKGTYDYCVYEQTDAATGITTTMQLQNVNRAFASNDESSIGVVKKCKSNKKDKIANLPDNVFVYNDEISSPEAIAKLKSMINWDYYIDRSYERIAEFLNIDYIKRINR